MNLIDMYAIEKMKMEQPSIGVELSPILDSASPRGDDLMSLLKRVSPKYSFKFRPSWVYLLKDKEFIISDYHSFNTSSLIRDLQVALIELIIVANISGQLLLRPSVYSW